MYALILYDKVVQVSDDKFDVAEPLTWVSCGPTIQAGDTYEDGRIVSQNEKVTLDDLRKLKQAEIAAFRYEKEVGGITVNGVEIATDRVSQQMLAAARTLAKEKKAQNLWYTFDWKAQNGWVQLTCDQIISIGDLVAAHVQNCFSQEKKFSNIIAGLSKKADIEELDYVSQWKDVTVG